MNDYIKDPWKVGDVFMANNHRLYQIQSILPCAEDESHNLVKLFGGDHYSVINMRKYERIASHDPLRRTFEETMKLAEVIIKLKQ